MSRRKPLLQPMLKSAIDLCQRPQGANSLEIGAICGGVDPYRAPSILRGYLKRYRPDLVLFSERYPGGGVLHGNRLRYFIRIREEQ